MIYQVYRRMCLGYMQILHHFISGTWASADIGIGGRSWNQPPTDTEGRCFTKCRSLYSEIVSEKIYRNSLVLADFFWQCDQTEFPHKEKNGVPCVCVSLFSERINRSEALGHSEPSLMLPESSHLDFFVLNHWKQNGFPVTLWSWTGSVVLNVSL